MMGAPLLYFSAMALLLLVGFNFGAPGVIVLTVVFWLISKVIR